MKLKMKWKRVMKQRVSVLTQIIGNFVRAICKHPEEHSVSAADQIASFIHPGCYEHTTGLYALQEDVTSDCEVLPGTYSVSVKSELAGSRSGGLLTGRVVLPTLTTDSLLWHWWPGQRQWPMWWAAQSEPVGRWRRGVRGRSCWCSTQTPQPGQQSLEPLRREGFLQEGEKTLCDWVLRCRQVRNDEETQETHEKLFEKSPGLGPRLLDITYNPMDHYVPVC